MPPADQPCSFPKLISLSIIRPDGGTQPRSAVSQETVDAYIEDMARGDPFPPVVLYFDGSNYWLADGFHRYEAATALGKDQLSADVRQGTRRDAVIHSVGANHNHGLPRTNGDKRRAVLTLLEDAEWSAWSDREIARACRVSAPLVGKLRPFDTVNVDSMAARTFTHPRSGKPSRMITGNIGRSPMAQGVPDVVHPFRAELPQGTASTEEQIEAVRKSEQANAFLHDALYLLEQQFDRLPPPESAAANYPSSLRHAFSSERAAEIGAWFSRFAKAWDRRNGARDVAA